MQLQLCAAGADRRALPDAHCHSTEIHFKLKILENSVVFDPVVYILLKASAAALQFNRCQEIARQYILVYYVSRHLERPNCSAVHVLSLSIVEIMLMDGHIA